MINIRYINEGETIVIEGDNLHIALTITEKNREEFEEFYKRFVDSFNTKLEWGRNNTRVAGFVRTVKYGPWRSPTEEELKEKTR